MIKKLSIITLAAVLPHLCYANAYLGIGAGPEFANFNQSATVVNPFTNVKDNTRLAGNGIFGSIFGGYGGYYQRFYLAGELNGNASSVAFQSSNSEFISGSTSTTHYRVQNSWGISLLPGYEVRESTLLYGRIGYVTGSLKVSTTDASLANVNHAITGFRYGAGVNQNFSEHFSARMEYSDTSYQNTTSRVVTGITTKTTTLSPETSQVEFALIYLFS